MDWNKAYLELLEYKEAKGFSNLIVGLELLRPVLEAGDQAYRLQAEESVVQPKSYDDQQRLQDAITNILRRYADKLYRGRQARWKSKNLAYRKLNHADANF